MVISESTSSVAVIPIVNRCLIAFADGNYSDRKASEILKEFGCFTLTHVTVADKVIEISDEIHAKLTDCNEEVRKVFQEAEGDTEFTADGAFINIRKEDKTHCWMECKVADFTKRQRGGVFGHFSRFGTYQ
jgi:hypothetical protein